MKGSDYVKEVIIGAMLLIIISLIMFILGNGITITNILGLSDSFWGALFGALIAGLTAILISNNEQNKRAAEKVVETKKVLLNLKEYSEELLDQLTSIEEVTSEIKEVYNPFNDVETITDEEGNDHFINFPSVYEIEVYHSITYSFKTTLTKAYNDTLDVLEKIKMIDISKLDLATYKKVLTFKQKSKKIIEPTFVYRIKMTGSMFKDNEYNEIHEIITDFHKTVS